MLRQRLVDTARAATDFQPVEIERTVQADVDQPGDAAFEGQVQWSGELGFGVRAPEGGQSGRRDDATTGSLPGADASPGRGTEARSSCAKCCTAVTANSSKPQS